MSDTRRGSAGIAGRARALPPALVAGAIAFVASMVLLALTLAAAEVPPAGTVQNTYVATFSPPQSPFEVLLNGGDGQAYAQIALDPGLRQVDAFRVGPGHLAFFAQRPLYPYLSGLLAGGARDRLPAAMVAVTALGGAFLAAGTTAVIAARGRGQRPLAGLIVLAVPTVLAALTAFGPDLLGPGLALLGLAWWRRGCMDDADSGSDRRHVGYRALATGAFVLAVLARETTIVLPAALGVEVLVRAWPRPWRALSRVAPLAAPVLAYFVWMLFVRARVGAGPEQVARQDSLSIPLRGFIAAVGGFSPADVIILGALFAALMAVGVIHRREFEAAVLGAYLVLALSLNANVWRTWTEVGRVLVPAVALAVVLGAPRDDTVPAEFADRA